MRPDQDDLMDNEETPIAGDAQETEGSAEEDDFIEWIGFV